MQSGYPCKLKHDANELVKLVELKMQFYYARMYAGHLVYFSLLLQNGEIK